MYSPVHATAGLLLAEALPNPTLAFVAGVASHYLLDAVPHGDSRFGEWLRARDPFHRIAFVESLDFGIATLLVMALLLGLPNPDIPKLVAGAVGGVIPDLLWGFRFLFDRAGWHIPGLTRFLHWHDRVHAWGHAKASYDIPFVIGIVLQGAALIVVLSVRL